MKIGFLIKSAVAQMYNRKYSAIFVTAVLVVSYLVFEYGLLIMVPSCFGNLIAGHIFTRDCEDILYLNMLKYVKPTLQETDNISWLIEAMQEMEDIEGAGFYYLNEGELPVLYVSKELTYLSDMRDTSGNAVDFSNRGELPGVSVGYALAHKYPVGSVIDIEGDSYEVTQVLKKGSCWVDDQIDSGAYINLDTKVVADAGSLLKKDSYYILNGMNSICYVVEPGADREQAKAKINERAKELGLEIYNQKSIAELFAEGREGLWEEKEIFIMPLVLIILATASVIVSSMITVYLRKQSLGILYAAGYSHRDIMWMYVAENLLKILLAHGLASAYWIMNQKSFLGMEENVSLMWLIEPMVIAVDVLMLVLGSAGPLREIKKTDLAKLIEGELV